MEEKKKSVFEVLNAINCNEHVEKKNGLNYLSWAWAWQICKANYPDASYTIYERENGIPYFTDGKTCWVKTGVTINGQEHIEYLPIMDFKNQSIPVEKVTSFDMNKSIQRSLTKALARHGLGLYIYAGEDLPDETPTQPRQLNPEPVQTAPIEYNNVSTIFPEVKDTIMDDLHIQILGAKTETDLKNLFANAKILLAKRAGDLATIKSEIIKKQRSMSNGQAS